MTTPTAVYTVKPRQVGSTPCEDLEMAGYAVGVLTRVRHGRSLSWLAATRRGGSWRSKSRSGFPLQAMTCRSSCCGCPARAGKRRLLPLLEILVRQVCGRSGPRATAAASIIADDVSASRAFFALPDGGFRPGARRSSPKVRMRRRAGSIWRPTTPARQYPAITFQLPARSSSYSQSCLIWSRALPHLVWGQFLSSLMIRRFGIASPACSTRA